jgi:hypothetical protein
MKNTNRGILLFAENNEKIDYLRLAILCAQCIKNNMGSETKVSVVTNNGSWENLPKVGADLESLAKSLFDKVIFTNVAYDVDNSRIYRDTQYHQVTAQFLNRSRSSAYELSPYDETLLIDVDYFVLNGSLNHVWGSNEDFIINKSAKTLLHKPLTGPEFRLNPFGIRMYWATVIYFKKSEKAKLIFDLVSHIKEAWNYYRHVYDFPGGLYRNDFSFSIALHMLNGFVDDNSFVKSFSDPEILTAIDTDQFISFDDKNTVRFYANDPVENWKFYVSKIRGVNVHCLNKISILNNFDKTLEVLK